MVSRKHSNNLTHHQSHKNAPPTLAFPFLAYPYTGVISSCFTVSESIAYIFYSCCFGWDNHIFQKKSEKVYCIYFTQKGIVRGNDPYLYGEKVKAYFIRGARRLPGQTQVPDTAYGWGALCVKDSLPG